MWYRFTSSLHTLFDLHFDCHQSSIRNSVSPSIHWPLTPQTCSVLDQYLETGPPQGFFLFVLPVLFVWGSNSVILYCWDCKRCCLNKAELRLCLSLIGVYRLVRCASCVIILQVCHPTVTLRIHNSLPVYVSAIMAATVAEVTGSSWLLSSGAIVSFLTLLLLFIVLTTLCSDCRRLASHSLHILWVLHHTT